jgi:DNA-binding NarL/FixJ family response regulator
MHSLTKREQQIADLIAQGLCNKRIARALGLSVGTVKVYLNRIYRKVGASNRTALAILRLNQAA